MSGSSFEAFVLSVDSSQNVLVSQKLVPILGDDGTLKVHELYDVTHQNTPLKSYAKQLKIMLDTQADRVFFVTSDNLNKMIDEENFNFGNKYLSDDVEAQNEIKFFIVNELNEVTSKIVLLTLVDGNAQPEKLKNRVENIDVFSKDKNELEKDQIDAVARIAKCRITRVVKTEEKKKKKFSFFNLQQHKLLVVCIL